MTSISQSLSFNTGLESIISSPSPAPANLPPMSALPPSDDAMEAQLPQLMQNHHFDQRILAALRPLIRNRDILSPGRYLSLADELPDALEEEANRTADPQAQKALRDAVKLLRDEKSLRDLLMTFRHALHKA